MSGGATLTRFLPDEAATLAWGGEWAKQLSAPLTVYLEGGLGAGKTTFTRGLLRGLGHTGTVKSPTYAIVESYALPQFALHHFDLYRFTSPEEWEDAGLDELFADNSVRLIEWPQQGGGFVPPADLTVSLSRDGSGRSCAVTAHTPQGRKILESWLN
ncbi:tRNA (adenosine(37)-N6)-threonylcarbamoyltransferase complex ATPase subunit type 1 TsaE [Neisseria chenwenguii]|uniref:tRNA threonylcarbamoyladenosine biosynthesis protein TsaE n=1 Tax=Neisseria chenwenguii TaxID=1853278 RepID=A0A220S3I5_9NEIS|nr:tRNA (adenosine(37)-N6)-threonylcarbamoyltransferase complex ATPase subunit type 1 TsaE [Neisseria chenwenguii]ASK27765.1 tRNA (adenosine(37)-N6)-threonylcarbamoyltransferase complex ATPase subunit type 1 TsaE [Neisseria chenwenguii]ROV56505.1 tRNA (adenosine(37)-N6)-threonylcarbamoyltransferase complex ATPase subunit type 1 TsaE [Neisseria chenwenguii]